MLDTAQDILVILLLVSGALLFRYILQRFWPLDARVKHNDIIGWQLGILGTTYAVILGFMLYTVWINFGAAEGVIHSYGYGRRRACSRHSRLRRHCHQ